MFFVLVPVLFVITFYVLNTFFAQYKHTYGRLQASHGSHMKAAHNVLYTSVRRYDTIALGLLKKEEELEEEEEEEEERRRRMPNSDFLLRVVST